jgi:ribosomal protein S18 acetylase RimI-like enzyme
MAYQPLPALSVLQAARGMISNHAVRLAVPTDAAGIARMSREYIEDGLGWSWTPVRVIRAMRDRTTNVAVAHAADRVLGFGIMRYGDTKAHLMLFAVHPAQRRKGLGTALLRWLEECAMTAGLERVQLEARADNAAGIGFYRNNGYAVVEVIKDMYRGLEDGVRLEKKFWPGPDPAEQ